jgi:predicted SAM-dependent methyltransferase
MKWLRRRRRPELPENPRLHVGCGRERFEGWVNIDAADLPGVDVVADVTRGLEFRDCEAIYAEHFLEHLPLDRAVDFLVEAHRALAPGGLLRLSTPNLDWVWMTHYHADAFPEAKQEGAIQLNRAFRGWEHQFLWNRELLGEALESCGFSELEWCRYRESRHDLFRGIERHESYPETPELPHVLIVEARRGPRRADRLAALRRRIDRDFLSHLQG